MSKAAHSLLCATSVVLLHAFAAPAAARMYGPEYAKCSEGTTLGIVECVQASTKAWDRRLNSAYKALMQSSDPPQREPLKAAQRLWIQYRDANCRFYGSADGSIRQIQAAECLRATTQQRTCELEAAGTQETRPRPGCE